jgi:hypothetical protein
MIGSTVMVGVKNETGSQLIVGFYNAIGELTMKTPIPGDGASHMVNLSASGGYTVGFWVPDGGVYVPASGCAAAGCNVEIGKSYMVVVATGGCTFS